MKEKFEIDISLIYNKITSFHKEDDTYDIESFIKFLYTIENNDTLLKFYVSSYLEYISYNHVKNFEDLNLLKIKDFINSEKLIRVFTVSELSKIFSTLKPKDITKKLDYILKLIDNLSNEQKEYWLAIKEKVLENKQDYYFEVIKKLAYKWFKPAIVDFKKYLLEKATLWSDVDSEILEFAEYIQDSKFLWDFYRVRGNNYLAIKNYKNCLEKEKNIACYFSIIETYFNWYFLEADLDEKEKIKGNLEDYLFLLSKEINLSVFYKINLNKIKWDFYFLIDGREEIAFNYYYEAYLLALRNNYFQYVEDLWIKLFKNFSEYFSPAELDQIVINLVRINPSSKLWKEYFYKTSNFPAILGLSLEQYSMWNKKDLEEFIQYITDYYVEKLDYNTLKILIDEEEIKEKFWNTLLLYNTENLKIIVWEILSNLSTKKLLIAQIELVDKLNRITSYIYQFKKKWTIRFEEDDEDFVKELNLDELFFESDKDEVEILEEIEEQYADKLYCMNKLLTLKDLRKTIERGKILQLYDVFSLFTLLQPEQEKWKKTLEYFSQLNNLYVKWFPYMNYWLYIFFKNIYVNPISAEYGADEDFKDKIEKIFKEAEKTLYKKKVNNAFIPAAIFDMFKQIFTYGYLYPDKFLNFSQFMFSLLDNKTIMLNNSIVTDLSFIEVGDKIVSVKKPKDNNRLWNYVTYHHLKNK